MSKKKGGRSASATRRGGRRPGVWVHVQPEEIRSYRERNGLSRAKLAEQLSVSATSIQNWELGRAASIPAQLQLRTLLDGGAPPGDAAESPLGVDLSVTGQIVAAYLSNGGKLPPQELPELVRRVRAALTD